MMTGALLDSDLGHSGGLERFSEISKGLRMALIISSYKSGMTNGKDCGGMMDALGSGGRDFGLGRGGRGLSRKGSKVFRNVVKMSDKSVIELNGRSRLRLVSSCSCGRKRRWTVCEPKFASLSKVQRTRQCSISRLRIIETLSRALP